MEPAQETPAPKPSKKRRKSFWTKQFYLWHWVSSAICLGSILLFAFTGITLNHAADITTEPAVSEIKKTLPENLLPTTTPEEKAPLPDALASHLTKELGTPIKGKLAEWSEYEIYLSLPRPGGDAWLVIDRETHELTYELTQRGVISYLNDLHKGRHTGTVWSWFLDVFSVACLIFSITGLMLLWIHSKRRPSTWPIIAAGLLLPIILALFFIH